MAYTPNVWKARTGTGLNRFIDQNEAIYDFTPAPLAVIEQGTPFSAEWMNHIETGVKEAHDAIADKQDQIAASGILKGDGAGGVSAAEDGEDYVGVNYLGKALPQRTSSTIGVIMEDATLALSQAGQMITVYSSSAVTITIPASVSVAFPIETEIEVVSFTDATITFAAESGVQIYSVDDKRSIDKKYAAASLKKVGSNSWLLVGALS